jgi:hypothetical protein
MNDDVGTLVHWPFDLLRTSCQLGRNRREGRVESC